MLQRYPSCCLLCRIQGDAHVWFVGESVETVSYTHLYDTFEFCDNPWNVSRSLRGPVRLWVSFSTFSRNSLKMCIRDSDLWWFVLVLLLFLRTGIHEQSAVDMLGVQAVSRFDDNQWNSRGQYRREHDKAGYEAEQAVGDNEAYNGSTGRTDVYKRQSVYSEVSSQLICTRARCILMPRKYFGFLAMDTVAWNVITPSMLGMVAFRTNV